MSFVIGLIILNKSQKKGSVVRGIQCSKQIFAWNSSNVWSSNLEQEDKYWMGTTLCGDVLSDHLSILDSPFKRKTVMEHKGIIPQNIFYKGLGI